MGNYKKKNEDVRGYEWYLLEGVRKGEHTYKDIEGFLSLVNKKKYRTKQSNRINHKVYTGHTVNVC